MTTRMSAKTLAAGVANAVLDEIEKTRMWDDSNYVRGYADGLARAMQIIKAEIDRLKEGAEDESDAGETELVVKVIRECDYELQCSKCGEVYGYCLGFSCVEEVSDYQGKFPSLGKYCKNCGRKWKEQRNDESRSKE